MIEVKNLSKNFGNVQAVRNVTFKVNEGDIVGFIGPNGAGKSTTMKLLTGFLYPSSGEALICGQNVVKNPTNCKMQIGYSPENAPLYEDMTVTEYLTFIAEVRGIETEKIPLAMSKVIKMCSLGTVVNLPIDHLSKGFRRRVSIAQALIHNPKVLILDEPTDGLDPNQKYEIRKLIKNLAFNKAVILSTHILDEVEAVCNRVVIISQGQIRFDGIPEQLKLNSKDGNIESIFRAITLGFNIDGSLPPPLINKELNTVERRVE